MSYISEPIRYAKIDEETFPIDLDRGIEAGARLQCCDCLVVVAWKRT
jgi:hypothetical protein